MRSAVRSGAVAVLVSFAMVGAAWAGDYIVVSSTDPIIAKGTALDGGAIVPLASGRELTIMSVNGAVRTYRGGEGVVRLPRLAEATNATAFDALLQLVRRTPPRRVTGAMRSVGTCRPVEELTNLDLIMTAEANNCRANASAALDIYIAREAATPTLPAAPEAAPDAAKK